MSVHVLISKNVWACLLLRPCWQAAVKAISDVCFQLQKKTFSIWGYAVVFFFPDLKGGNMFPSRDVRLPPPPSRAQNDWETFSAHLVHHLSNIHNLSLLFFRVHFILLNCIQEFNHNLETTQRSFLYFCRGFLCTLPKHIHLSMLNIQKTGTHKRSGFHY